MTKPLVLTPNRYPALVWAYLITVRFEDLRAVHLKEFVLFISNVYIRFNLNVCLLISR